MTARPTLASVVILSQHQQVTTQQEQTDTHSSTSYFLKPTIQISKHRIFNNPKQLRISPTIQLAS